ncbi:twin-arginine translocation signal domain-containing protein [Rhizobium leguminosarum]|uniref:twin-arginine translocation signal domain-containing protein n=1 Tax=Rhizobium leguminosarum TaxID=384 RepID=UPI001030EF2E|nr:twin-arginine translocation signal domain-containing protein [Rhizobium leguminosarum]TBD04224.1 twin-arginine translocation signal domain-containing protein [Rhizobium leguminosarum]
MNRRTFLGGAAAATVAVQAAPPVKSAEEIKRDEDAYIIGTYVLMTPDKRAFFRKSLELMGEDRLAAAFARLA